MAIFLLFLSSMSDSVVFIFSQKVPVKKIAFNINIFFLYTSI